MYIPSCLSVLGILNRRNLREKAPSYLPPPADSATHPSHTRDATQAGTEGGDSRSATVTRNIMRNSVEELRNDQPSIAVNDQEEDLTSIPTIASRLSRSPLDSDEAKIVDRGILAVESHVRVQRWTYCDWSKQGRSPETFTQLTSELIATARKNGCIFLRKFRPKNNAAAEGFEQWLLLVAEEVFGESEDSIRNARNYAYREVLGSPSGVLELPLGDTRNGEGPLVDGNQAREDVMTDEELSDPRKHKLLLSIEQNDTNSIESHNSKRWKR